MHDALWVLVGVFIGSTLGLVLGGILCSGKVTDLETELWELRHQRKLLKEEIVRLTAKIFFTIFGRSGRFIKK